MCANVLKKTRYSIFLKTKCIWQRISARFRMKTHYIHSSMFLSSAAVLWLFVCVHSVSVCSGEYVWVCVWVCVNDRHECITLSWQSLSISVSASREKVNLPDASPAPHPISGLPCIPPQPAPSLIRIRGVYKRAEYSQDTRWPSVIPPTCRSAYN